MTQNTEQNVRTRDEQVARMFKALEPVSSFWRGKGPEGAAIRRYLEASIQIAEARGAEEQRRKDAPRNEIRRENALLRTAMSTIASYAGGYAEPTCAVEFLAHAVPEEVRLRIAALEAHIAELKEAERLARADAEASKARVGLRLPLFY